MGIDDPLNSDISTFNQGSLILGNSVSDPNSPVNITINSGAIMAAGVITIRKNVSIAIAGGGQIVSGKPLYMTDADGDGWPEDFTVYTATAAGRRRMGLMRSTAVADCNDAPGNYDLANASGTYYQDADGDGKGNSAVSSGACFQPPGYVVDNTDCNDGSASVSIPHAQCYTDADGDTFTNGLAASSTCLNTSSCDTATYASASTTGAATTGYTAGRLKNSASGTNDCKDTGTSANLVMYPLSCFHDSDNDDYGVATTKTCMNTNSCATATYGSTGTANDVTNINFSSLSTDCYDSNANAKPGSTYCSATNRGDGSYDYNCSSTQTKCGTNYDRTTVGVNRNYTIVTGKCNNCNRGCSTLGNIIYDAATINCGQTGAICTSFGGEQGGSCTRDVGEMCSAYPACSDYHGSSTTGGLCNGISSGAQTCQ